MKETGWIKRQIPKSQRSLDSASEVSYLQALRSKQSIDKELADHAALLQPKREAAYRIT